ncbi:DUF3040 domain-containing protein [Streptomyces sp. TR1341]|uniref:DUF3040 domain-containing protein n=1 Tax=Streptomyces murinus TaxID=33900 RepID=A0A7W3RJD7_STRMR|nr:MULTISPECIES: DUF3040 domain-containing protein [Streptomyces]MBA9051856.1 hypothetical protein [Streptomyces murinus]NDK24902.1 DUF3040 domain-containing protein [Streptomyces sp. TR1341]UWW93164.1 DUF3040 domain-containing protein [Streptomyces murinus]WSI83813.1 DUF3040 domain-containing protein [Streptomyces murinus]
MDDWDMWDRRERTRLSPRERLALLEIEAHLREDRGFARRMGGGAHRERADRAHRRIWLPTGVLLLALASAFCAVMGIRTADPGLLWCFAVLWPLTLFQAFRLLCRLARRRGRAAERASSWL